MGVDQVSRHDHSSDADGGESISPTAVSTKTVNGIVNVASFNTFQDAIDYADVGGELWFDPTETFKVSNYGNATINKPLSFTGRHARSASSIEAVGSTIRQDTTSPAFQIPSGEDIKAISWNGVGFNMDSNAPILENLGTANFSTISEVYGSCNANGGNAFNLVGENYFLTLKDVYVRRADPGPATTIETLGGQVTIRDSSFQAGSSATGGPILDVGVESRLLLDSVDVGGSTDVDGIHIYQPSTRFFAPGGTIQNCSAESVNRGFVVGEAGKTNASVVGVELLGNFTIKNDGPGVLFDDAVGCVDRMSVLEEGSSSGTAGEATSNAAQCGFQLSEALRAETYDVSPGNRCHVHFQGTPVETDGRISGFTAPTEGSTVWNKDDAGLNVKDPQGWFEVPHGTKGVETQSGDGSTKTFSIPHGLSGRAPSMVSVDAASEDASTDFYVSDRTGTDIEITYPAAPASGTDNLQWIWIAAV